MALSRLHSGSSSSIKAGREPRIARVPRAAAAVLPRASSSSSTAREQHGYNRAAAALCSCGIGLRQQDGRVRRLAPLAATVYHEVSVPLAPPGAEDDAIELREPPTRITATGRVVASEFEALGLCCGWGDHPHACTNCSFCRMEPSKASTPYPTPPQHPLTRTSR